LILEHQNLEYKCQILENVLNSKLGDKSPSQFFTPQNNVYFKHYLLIHPWENQELREINPSQELNKLKAYLLLAQQSGYLTCNTPKIKSPALT